MPSDKPAAKNTITVKKTAPVKAKAKPKSVMYVTKSRAMAHPFQGVRFYPRAPVECREDDWLKAQINAGHIRKIK